MKRLFLIIILSGLFMNSQATLVIERYSNAPTSLEFDVVRSIIFKPSYEITILTKDGKYEVIQQVRTINFDNLKPTSIENVSIQKSSIKVYPNPTADIVMIENLKIEDELVVYSLNGSILLRETTLPGINTIDVSGLTNGIYLMKISNETFKLIKE